MSLVLHLPPELEAKLAAEAAQLGLALPEYALWLMARADMCMPPRATAWSYWRIGKPKA